MIQAKETYKEELSKHVEGIFKKYVKPGLHICDIATGGGKSYTIGKLTCEYYPKHFDRIVILCVQNNIIRKSKFPQNPKRSVRFSGKGTKRSVQKRKARNTQKAETKVL